MVYQDVNSTLRDKKNKTKNVLKEAVFVKVVKFFAVYMQAVSGLVSICGHRIKSLKRLAV